MVNERIEEYCIELKLKGILENYAFLADKPAKENLSFSEFLYLALEAEYEIGNTRAKQTILTLTVYQIRYIIFIQMVH